MSDERLPELFEEASALAGDERREFLERLHREEPAIAEELASLLEPAAAAPSPIDAGPWTALPEAPPEVAAPERVGPYRLLREIGRGGMGRVYLAEQETPDFRRTVALKLIDRPEAAVDEVRRFRDEVRILASLDHPGIVRFLDGGRSAEGIWFLALEYVEGENLLAHADRHRLSVRERLRLFRATLDAVAHAHRAGVVHRDLKPGNILVGIDHRPRLLDFGIAKLLDPESPEATATVRGRTPLTPAYASPEQLAGAPATPASDIYSLGVVLYELVSGRRPPQAPTPPSAGDEKDVAPSGGSASRIPRALHGLCLRALRPTPTERFSSAEDFAAHLDRYLAGPAAATIIGGSRWRLALLSAVAAALLLLAGYLATRAARERASPSGPLPQSASDRFPFDPVNPPPAALAEREFLRHPSDLAAGAAWVIRLIRDRRLDEARIGLDRLRQVPGQAPEPLVDFAESQLALARREDQAALVLLSRALATAIERQRADLVGTLRMSRGALLEQLGDPALGVAELERSSLELERARDHRPHYRALVDLAIGHLRGGRMDRGEELLNEAIATARVGGFDPATAWTNLVQLHLVRGRPDLAEPLARSLVALRKQGPAADPAREGDALARLFVVLRDLNRSDEADIVLAEGIALLRSAGHPDWLAGALYERGIADLETGRLETIERIAVELEGLGAGSRRRRPLGYAHALRARLRALRGDLPAARAEFAASSRLLQAEGDRDLAAVSDLVAAEVELLAGNAAVAREAANNALAGLEQAELTAAGFFAEGLLARAYAAEGELVAARRHLQALGEAAASSPSVSRRLAILRARGEVAASAHLGAEARADLLAALRLAQAGRLKVAELEIRLALLHVEGEDSRTGFERIASEAASLGLADLHARARTRTQAESDHSRL